MFRLDGNVCVLPLSRLLLFALWRHDSKVTRAAFPLVFSQSKSDISKFSTKCNCSLQAFPLKGVKRTSFNSPKISSRSHDKAAFALFIYFFCFAIAVTVFSFSLDNSLEAAMHELNAFSPKFHSTVEAGLKPEEKKPPRMWNTRRSDCSAGCLPSNSFRRLLWNNYVTFWIKSKH